MTSAKTTPEVPELAQKAREQLVATVQQGQQLSVDAAETWAKAVSAIPIPELPSIPGVPGVPTVEATLTYTFDVVSDLLAAQREYALKMAKALTLTTS